MTQHAWLMSRSCFAIRSSKNVLKSTDSFFLHSPGTYKCIYIIYIRIWTVVAEPSLQWKRKTPLFFFVLFCFVLFCFVRDVLLLLLLLFLFEAEASVKKGKRFGMPV